MAADRNLSREQFEAVIRRASELAARDTDSSELSEAELYRIAREVGLSEQHVQSALRDLRTGTLAPGSAEGGGVIGSLFGPETVRASRVVEGTPAELASRLDDFLVAGKLLEPLRRNERFLQYRPAVDWISQIARAASATRGRYYVASAKSVEVRLEPVDETGTLVEMEVDPGTRGDAVVGTILGGVSAGIAGGAGVSFLLAAVLPLLVAVGIGLVSGAALVSGITAYGSGRHRRKLREVRGEVEGILDGLEREDGLEPPPPAWRRWVERHFHGARKLLDTGDQDDLKGNGFV